MGWLWMGSTMILFWGGIVLLAIWAIRAISRSRQAGDSPISTLNRRLAGGEISQAEFETAKKSLGQTS